MLASLNSVFSHWQDWWLLALLAFLIGAIPSWLPIIRDRFSPRFRVESITMFKGRGAFTLYTNWQDGWHVDPLDLGVTLVITNKDSRARGITGYEMKVKSDRGWTNLIRVELPPPSVLEFRTDASHAPVCINFARNNLNARLRSGPVEPYRSVEGWAFFASNDDPGYLGSVQSLRLTIFDSLGDRTSVDVQEQKAGSTQASLGVSTLAVIDSAWVPPWRGGNTPPPPSE